VHEAREVAYGGAQQFVGKRLKVTMIILLFSLSALLFEIHDQDFWWVLPHYLGFFSPFLSCPCASICRFVVCSAAHVMRLSGLGHWLVKQTVVAPGDDGGCPTAAVSGGQRRLPSDHRHANLAAVSARPRYPKISCLSFVPQYLSVFLSFGAALLYDVLLSSYFSSRFSPCTLQILGFCSLVPSL
jgi:hypothetical protein